MVWILVVPVSVGFRPSFRSNGLLRVSLMFREDDFMIGSHLWMKEATLDPIFV